MNYELRKNGFMLARNMGKMPMLRRGFTLVELLVVIVIIALLVAAAIPSARALKSSYESTGTESMISSAFSSARAIAAREHRYAGVRFQKAYDATKPNVIDWPQYMIFVVYDTEIGNGKPGNLGCRVVEGLKPIKLPDNMGVVESITNDADIDTEIELAAKTTFSILFSPTGKLIIHDLWIRNKDNSSGDSSTDETFNSINNVTNNGIGMFFQDTIIATDIESSAKEFVIYDKTRLKAVDANRRWNDYLRNVPEVHINQYTGTMIEK